MPLYACQALGSVTVEASGNTEIVLAMSFAIEIILASSVIIYNISAFPFCIIPHPTPRQVWGMLGIRCFVGGTRNE